MSTKHSLCVLGCSGALALVLVGPSARAADEARPADPLLAAFWQRWDANRDQKLQVEELSAELVKLAVGLDRDGDKTISPDEFRQAVEGLRGMLGGFVTKERETRDARREALLTEIMDRSVPLDGIQVALETLDENGDRELSVREGVTAVRFGLEQVEQQLETRLDAICRDLKAGKLPRLRP